MVGSGEVIDGKAREMAASAIAGVESLRDILSERERNEQRRWDESRSWTQESFRRIEGLIQTLQNSYRDGVEALSREFHTELATHVTDDAEQFERIADWKDKVLYSVIGFLALSVLSLIGVVYHMVPK